MKEIMSFEELCNTAEIEIPVLRARCESIIKELDKFIDLMPTDKDKLSMKVGKYSTDTYDRNYLLDVKTMLVCLAYGNHVVSLVREDG